MKIVAALFLLLFAYCALAMVLIYLTVAFTNI
jgi:hypothetical protein